MARKKPRNKPSFTPVPLRPRHDGWTAERQVAFIAALAEGGCVDEACRAVGMGRASAYALRTRNDSVSFRAAWEAALDLAICGIKDAAYGRARNGVVRPVFFQGEQIGERRYFDERLTMFLLRTRNPEEFGAWRDRFVFNSSIDARAQRLAALCDLMVEKAVEDELGIAIVAPPAPPLAPPPEYPTEDPPEDPETGPT